MIRVVSGWVEARLEEMYPQKWTRYFHDLSATSDYPLRYRVTVAVFTLEAHQTKTPVWRRMQLMCQQVCPERLQADIYLEQRKTEFSGKFVILTSPYPWIDGLYPNKALNKGEIVQMFPECKEMPRPYALDYVRDRA